jgi:DNA-binding transcriptional ArsR family regulator
MGKPTHLLLILEDLLVSAIREEGAISRTRAREITQEEPLVVDQMLARLVLQGRATWVTGLPKQGIFFTEPENRGKYGLPLMSSKRKGTGSRSKQPRQRGRRKEIYDFMAGWGEGTIDSLAEEIGWSRDSVKRHLDRLEKNGLVVSELLHDGKRGRPPKVWSRTDETTSEDLAEVDFTGAHDAPRGHEATRQVTRRKGGP